MENRARKFTKKVISGREPWDKYNKQPIRNRYSLSISLEGLETKSVEAKGEQVLMAEGSQEMIF
jgi:hypothetical protein